MTTKLKLLHIVGARPQFPKLAAVMRAMREQNERGSSVQEWVVHTGQHYDDRMSAIFFDELGIREPDFNLGVGSGSLSAQTAAGLERVASIIEQTRPHAAVVYGDTNATLAGNLAAVQAQVWTAHVEAGVRTGNLFQAEELNRVIVDRISRARYCCTEFNLQTLIDENLGTGSVWTGDTMLDNYRYFLPKAEHSVVEKLGLEAGGYILLTLHRAENTDAPERLGSILDALITVQRNYLPLVFPIHPRTRKEIASLGRLDELKDAGVKLIEPQGFLALQALLEQSRLVVSDSGGLQREAYFAGRDCVVPWEYASWPELVEAGWVHVGSVEPRALVERIRSASAPRTPPELGLFGSGDAGVKIAALLLERAERSGV